MGAASFLILLACAPFVLSGVVDNGSLADFHVCLTPVHYCLIADSSNSISSELWAQLTSVIRSIATGIDIGPGANESKVALIQYGRKVVRIFNLTDNPDKATVLDAISSAQQLERTRPGGTSTPDAILECLKIFEEQSQTGVPKVIMVFSGGVTRYPRRSDAFEEQRLREAVNMSSAAGTTNYGVIFTGNDPERAQREALTIAQGVEERAFNATMLAELEMELIRDLACACSVNVEGTISVYAVGESVLSEDPCMECVCAGDENIICSDILCPSPPTCPPGFELETNTVPGQCCLMYNCTELTCSVNVNGTISVYKLGEIVPSDDPCMECVCARDEYIVCLNISCPTPPTCPPGSELETNTVPGQCCPMYNCTELTCSVNVDGTISVYAVGDSVPSEDPCMECVCAGDENITCSDILCPSPPTCPPGFELETNTVPGQCCPMYNCTELMCSVSSGMGSVTTYRVGETIPSDDPCLTRTCIANGSIITTDISPTCPPPACAQGYVPMKATAPGDECCAYVCEPFCSLTSCLNGGLCCAEGMQCVCPPGFTGERCEKCVFARAEYDVGETIVTFNPCEICTCGPSWQDNCYDIACPGCPEGYKQVNREFVPGECCPRFQCEPPCIIDGTGYGVGDTVPTDPNMPCEDKCVCAADGSRDCTMKECPELDCDQSRQHTMPGECCPRCTEGPCGVPTHYCMIADSSRSIFSSQVKGLWEDLKQVIGTIVESFPIGPNTTDSKVALVKYAAYLEDQGVLQVEREFTFMDNTNKPSVLQAILAMEAVPFEEGPGNGGTATPEAIRECLDIFSEQSSEEVPKVIVVFTDGVTHYFNVPPEVARQRLSAAVDSATDAGVTNYGVVFISNDKTEEAMFEALEIAQQVRDRAFYGGSLQEIQESVIAALNCESEE